MKNGALFLNSHGTFIEVGNYLKQASLTVGDDVRLCSQTIWTDSDCFEEL